MYKAYCRAESINSALAALNRTDFKHPVMIAGGTDLLLRLRKGVVKADLLVDISGIRELKRIQLHKDEVCIGAAVTFSEMIESPILQKELPLLVEASRQIGATQIRNMGTIGGNLCTASGAADLVPCLVALDAHLVLVGPQGERRLPIHDFILTNRKTALGPGELLQEIRVRQMPKAASSAFFKMGLRASQAISVVNAAVVLTMNFDTISHAVIVVGGAGPKAIRCREAEKELAGKAPSGDLFKKAGEAALAETSPMDDIRGSAAFREHLVNVLVEKALHLAHTRAIQKMEKK